MRTRCRKNIGSPLTTSAPPFARAMARSSSPCRRRFAVADPSDRVRGSPHLVPAPRGRSLTVDLSANFPRSCRRWIFVDVRGADEGSSVVRPEQCPVIEPERRASGLLPGEAHATAQRQVLLQCLSGRTSHRLGREVHVAVVGLALAQYPKAAASQCLLMAVTRWPVDRFERRVRAT